MGFECLHFFSLENNVWNAQRRVKWITPGLPDVANDPDGMHQLEAKMRFLGDLRSQV